MNHSAPQEPSESGAADAPAAHEEFVRGIDNAFGRTYSLSGLAVIAAVALVAGLTAVFLGVETLKTPPLWIGLVLVFLVSLFVIRIFVALKARELLAKTQRYCQVHDLHIKSLRADHTKDGAYQYFESVFEVVERRNIPIEAVEPQDAPQAETSDDKESRS